jgi:hypothetical protein
MNGWIKLHRKLLENAIFYKPDYFQVWVFILLKVNHEEKQIIWNNEKKLLKKGSGIFSQKDVAKYFNFSRAKVKRILEYLENEHQILVKTYSKFTEIQVVNWEEYQESISSEHQTNISRASAEHQLYTDKNDKNYKKEEREIFDNARLIFPGKKNGLDTEFNNFIKKTKDFNEVIHILEEKIKAQISIREAQKRKGEFVPPWKHFKTWINNRCWEEEPEMSYSEPKPSNSKTLTEDEYKLKFQA